MVISTQSIHTRIIVLSFVLDDGGVFQMLHRHPAPIEPPIESSVPLLHSPHVPAPKTL